MAERIIGQALYEMHCAADSELAYTWNDLPPSDRMAYMEVATILNAQYLAPLQGLAEQLRADFQRLKVMDGDIQREQDVELSVLQRENDACKAVLTSYRVLVECVEVPESWQEERSKLLRLTTQLLDAEQKEG